MSRRKDRDRYLAMKATNPEYLGFRGYGEEAPRPEPAALQTVTCSRCGRRRNAPVEVVQEQGDQYVCLSCLEEAGAEPGPGDAEEDPQSDDPQEEPEPEEAAG